MTIRWSIRTHARADTIRDRTVAMLLDANVPPEDIDVWATPDQTDDYRAAVGDLVSVHSGGNGLDGQLRVMRDHYDDGQPVVYLDDEVLEKPLSRADAIRMLTTIAGREHVVYTGVALRNVEQDYADTRVLSSKVRMIPLTPKEIEWYVDTGEPMDKAGAYAIQGIGAMFIESVEGSYSNVVGLPLSEVFAMLKRAGLEHLVGTAPR